jgi:septum formation protein
MMDQILLTADQVVVYDNKILEKPQNKEEARVFMEGYGLLPCSTVGSIVLTDLSSKKRVQGVDICNIYFDPIPENIIQQLLDEGKEDKCALF